MKAIVIYYSWGGNTKSIAEKIARELNCGAARIYTVVPYEGDYNSIVDRGADEVKRGYEPEIKPLGIDLSDYDTVMLGTPVWWYTFAPAVKTFLSHNDLTGKKIYTFATNGGWIGHTLKDVKSACPGADVKPGIDIRFDDHTQRTSDKEVEKWIKNIK